MNDRIQEIIIQRANERQARENARPCGRSFPICPKLSLPCVPFKLWALIAHQINDVGSVKTYKRAALWREYAYEMYLMGFDWENSAAFGLDESFP